MKKDGIIQSSPSVSDILHGNSNIADDIVKNIENNHMSSFIELVRDFITGPQASWGFEEPDFYEDPETAWKVDLYVQFPELAPYDFPDPRVEFEKRVENQDEEIAKLILEEIRQMIDRNLIFGDHSKNKRWLKLNESEAKIKNEIEKLKKEMDIIKPDFTAALIYLELLETQLGKIDPSDPERHRAIYWSRAKQAAMDLQ